MMSIRRTGTAFATTLLGLSVAVGLTFAIAPVWIRSMGLDLWNLPDALARAHNAESEKVRLARQAEQYSHEFELADHLAAGLAAGTLSLPQATDVMEPIMRNRTWFDCTIWRSVQQLSVRMATARYLISRIENFPIAEPDQYELVLARLEAEFDQMEESQSHVRDVSGTIFGPGTSRR